MTLPESDIRRIRAQVLDILQSYIRISEYKIFFFGSRVEGTAGERSDIDIGIDGEKIDETKFAEIQDRINEIETPYTIQITDFSDADADFKETALKYVECF